MTRFLPASIRGPTVPVIAGVVVMVAVVACNDSRTSEYPQRNATRGTALLPPTPNLNPKMPPVHYDDDSYSVHGVRESGSKLARKPLSVRGYVAALHRCPDGAKRCNPAPYIQLTDAKNLHGRRLLVGGVLDDAGTELKIGAQVTLHGRLVTRSPDGLYFAPSGLLLLDPPTAEKSAKKGDRKR